MDINNTFDEIIEQGKMNIKAEPGDYINEEDGLLYCGKCHTKKQTIVNIFGRIRKPMCVCTCEAERMEAKKKEEERQEFERKVKRLRRSGFPKSEMAEWTFENDDMKNPKITKAMENYANNFHDFMKKGQGLLLYGNCGTGKTYAACEVANALIDEGYPVLATNFARLTNTLQGMYEGKQTYIDSLNGFSLLIIDDLGAERTSEFMQEMIYTIIDSRYRAGLPMIITTNMDISKIKNPANVEQARIYDRIIERCFPIKVTGESRRRGKIKENYNHLKDLLGI